MGPMGDPTVNLLSVLPPSNPSNPSMHKKAGNLEGMDSSSVACDWLTDCTRTVPRPIATRSPTPTRRVFRIASTLSPTAA